MATDCHEVQTCSLRVVVVENKLGESLYSIEEIASCVYKGSTG